MRPVAAPEHPIGVGADDSTGQRRDIGKIGGLAGRAVWRRNLHVDAARFQEVEQTVEPGLIDAERRSGTSKMAEDDGMRERADFVGQGLDHRKARVELNVPIAARQLARKHSERAFGGPRLGVLRRLQIEPRPLNARFRELIELERRHRAVENDNTAGTRAEAPHRVERAGIIGSVDARGDDHHPVEPERGLQSAQTASGSATSTR